MTDTTPIPKPADPVPVWPHSTPTAYARLRDRAIERAHVLRDEAIAELWGGAGALWGDAVDQARRAADRLAARLRQHARQRAAAGGSDALGA